MHKCPRCKRAIIPPAWKRCENCDIAVRKIKSAKARNDKRKMLLLSQNNKVDSVPRPQSEDAVSPLLRSQALS